MYYLLRIIWVRYYYYKRGVFELCLIYKLLILLRTILKTLNY